MKMSPRIRYLIAGIALILMTNVIALGGVAYNRSGNPESTLKLTQRELGHPYAWGYRRKNSGIDLTLQWRVLNERDDVAPHFIGMGYAGFGGSPKWLDKAKLGALGFDVLKLENPREDRFVYNRQRAKEVLLVLELDGEAYQHALEIARQSVTREEALLMANAEKVEFGQRLKNARNWLEFEENKGSRLFVVDAGTDLGTLRARYPDTAKYAIVHGLARPQVSGSGQKMTMGGYISQLSVANINMPLPFRQVFESKLQDAHFEAEVAFGRRLEPWIVAAPFAKM